LTRKLDAVSDDTFNVLLKIFTSPTFKDEAVMELTVSALFIVTRGVEMTRAVPVDI
jgi:hypothetical protein